MVCTVFPHPFFIQLHAYISFNSTLLNAKEWNEVNACKCGSKPKSSWDQFDFYLLQGNFSQFSPYICHCSPTSISLFHCYMEINIKKKINDIFGEQNPRGLIIRHGHSAVSH